jgi:hypothetical protein
VVFTELTAPASRKPSFRVEYRAMAMPELLVWVLPVALLLLALGFGLAAAARRGDRLRERRPAGRWKRQSDALLETRAQSDIRARMGRASSEGGVRDRRSG